MQREWRSHPRYFFRRTTNSPLIVGAIFIFVSLILLGIGFFFLNDTLQFLKEAPATATGTVIKCPQTVSSSNSSSTSCTPTVAFKTANGEEMRFTAGFSSSDFQVGQQLPVRYNPAHPQDARIATFLGLWLVPTLLLGIGGVFFLLGGGVIVSIFFRRSV